MRGMAAGVANVAREGASAASSPLRRAASSVKDSYESGARGGANAATSSDAASGEPGWASRMRRRQTASHGATAASHAVRSGDHPSSGTSIDLSEE
jgi:type IV secretion system protein TrbL